jgi:hypothetical protein
MDESLIDVLTRWSYPELGRRLVLARVCGSIGVALGLLMPDDASGKNTQPRKRCGNGKKRCGKKCVRGDCCPGKPCRGSGTCTCARSVHGTRVCTETLGGVCVQCETTALSCAAGQRCVQVSDCGSGITAICKPLCGM